MKIEGSFRLLVWEGPGYFRTMVGQNVMAGEWGRIKPHVSQAKGKEGRLGFPLDSISQRPNLWPAKTLWRLKLQHTGLWATINI